MKVRRLLVGVIVTAVLTTTLTLSWVALGPLRSVAPPAEQAAAAAPSVAAVDDATLQWSTAWSTSPSAANLTKPAGHTVRNVVHTTIGGPRVRLRLTNRFGSTPVRFGHVTVAISAHTGGRRDGSNQPSDGTAEAGTLRDVTFGGRGDITVPVGADVLSDPVYLAVAADTDLLVTVWTPVKPPAATYHAEAKQTSFVSPSPADRAADQAATAFTEDSSAWFYTTGVEVAGGPGTIVALGDSITNGAFSTPGRNRRWTDHLAARLATSPVPDYGVANAGLGGNRILLDGQYPRTASTSISGRSAVNRYAQDVLEQPGARTVVIFEGINDIIQKPQPATAEQIIAGLSQLAVRSRAQGLRVVGGTIAPWKGYPPYTAARDRVRLQVNEWIRAGGGGTFDAVADFDQALRDPVDPLRLRPEYDGGDHLHPNDAGTLAIANAVPLEKL